MPLNESVFLIVFSLYIYFDSTIKLTGIPVGIAQNNRQRFSEALK